MFKKCLVEKARLMQTYITHLHAGGLAHKYAMNTGEFLDGGLSKADHASLFKIMSKYY